MTQIHPDTVVARVHNQIRARRGDIVKLLARLVAAPSENPPGDERAVCDVLTEFLATSNKECRRLAADPRRPNLIASYGPGGGPTLLLAAHTDTVRAGPGWTHDPHHLTHASGRLYGLGTCDNKGAVAAMAVACTTLAEVNAISTGRILLVLNCDEEAGSRFGMDFLRDAITEQVDAAIIAEPSGIEDDFESLWIEARATLRFEIAVQGTASHSSLAHLPGPVNAADELLRLVPAFSDALHASSPDGQPPIRGSLVLVCIDSGGPWGVVPNFARARLELRLDPGYTRDGLTSRLRAALAHSMENRAGRATIVMPGESIEWVPSSSVAATEPVVEAVRQAWRQTLGVEPAMGCFPGGTDARALSERGIPTIPGLGPGALRRAHAPDEYVTIEALENAAHLYALSALTYLRGSR